MIRNTFINFAGQAIPLFMMIAAFPVIIHGMGLERFGVFSLLWALFGLMSMLNFGISRATTKFVAEFRQKENRKDLGELMSTSILLHLALGVLLGAILYFLRPLASDVLEIPPHLLGETRLGLLLVSIGFPMLLVLSSLRGILEGYELFGVLNVIRVGSDTTVFLGLALASLMQSGLPMAIGVILIVRALNALCFLAACWRAVREFTFSLRVDRSALETLLGYGLWISISDVLNALVSYVDRFMVGALLSVTAVAYYVVPQEVANRLWILPISVVTTVFPIFSGIGTRDSSALHNTFVRAIKGTLFALGPVCFFLLLTSKDSLHYWLDGDFPQRSTLVFQILISGLLLSATAPVTASLLRAVGYAKQVALLHTVEVPLHMLILWKCVKLWGIEGAAFAWSLRAVLRSILLFLVATQLHLIAWDLLARERLPQLFLLFTLAIPVAISLPLLVQGSLLYCSAFLAMATLATISWLWVLNGTERRSFVCAAHRAIQGVLS